MFYQCFYFFNLLFYVFSKGSGLTQGTIAPYRSAWAGLNIVLAAISKTEKEKEKETKQKMSD